jgi:hypothetical protein
MNALIDCFLIAIRRIHQIAQLREYLEQDELLSIWKTLNEREDIYTLEAFRYHYPEIDPFNIRWYPKKARL